MVLFRVLPPKSEPDQQGRRRLVAGIVGSLAAWLAGCDARQLTDAASEPVSVTNFPLSHQKGKRYLSDALGRPFLIHGDVAWSIAGQLTDAEIELYLDNRQAKGFNTILFNAPEPYYTSQSPPYNNVDGVAPFSPMPDFSQPNEPYWARVDRIVNGAKARGIVCMINPAYLGYPGGMDGWAKEIAAASESQLKTYGVFLAERYRQQNVIWCMGGDRDESILIKKQWNVASGIRTVRPDDIICAHPLADRVNADDAYTYWSSAAGFSLNAIYGYETSGFFVYELAAQAYDRPGPLPFVGFEFKYENAAGADAAMLRRQSYGSILAGACGQFFGNLPIWHFDSPRWSSETYPGNWKTNLDSAGANDQRYVKRLFSSLDWWKLIPKPDASLVTSNLGTGRNRLYPALASDASFAAIYVPHRQYVSIAMSSLRPNRVRARLYDPKRGIYAPAAGSPFGNSGIAHIWAPGEGVLVLDEAL
jgi:hypothetical protein